MIATARGSRKAVTAALAASRSRSSNRATASPENDVGKLDVDGSRFRRRRDRKPALAEDVDHAEVLGEHLGEEQRDVVLFGDLGEMGQQERAEALALEAVGDRERYLGPLGLAADV